jgi:hypothetical protein
MKVVIWAGIISEFKIRNSDSIGTLDPLGA